MTDGNEKSGTIKPRSDDGSPETAEGQAPAQAAPKKSSSKKIYTANEILVDLRRRVEEKKSKIEALEKVLDDLQNMGNENTQLQDYYKALLPRLCFLVQKRFEAKENMFAFEYRQQLKKELEPFVKELEAQKAKAAPSAPAPEKK